MSKGVDVSYHNGKIDWKKVKTSGVDFAMLRTGFGWDNDSQIDRQLQANIEGCEAAGLPYGFYHYSYAMNAQEARKEAAFFLKTIREAKPLYPAAFDFEEKNQLSLPPESQLAVIEAFLNAVESAGYYGMLYMSASPMEQLRQFSPQRLDRLDRWIAHVGVSKPSFSGNYGIWQYSWKGKVEGIEGSVDLNEAYKDYPAIIRTSGLNGWKKTEPEPPSTDTVPKAQYDRLLTERDMLQKRCDALIQSVRELTEGLDVLKEKAEKITA